MSTLKVDGIRSNSASSDAITLANDGTCTANITNNLSNRNLLHNGSFIIHQRGGTTTTSGFLLDRWYVSASGGTATFSQGTETSGTVYEKGLVNYHRITNTANSTAAGAYRYVRQAIEAQNLLKSGWNYKSASAKITLSFYVRSSVAQNFYGYLRLSDSPDSKYIFETGSLSADTWTKVTKVIPGYTSANINNDNGAGMQVLIAPFWGTNYTASGTALNTWAAFASGERAPDYATTWAGTNGATFDITGVQLEVGSVATDFEHRTFHDELHRCFRYYYEIAPPVAESLIGDSLNYDTMDHMTLRFPVEMRVEPSFICSDFSNAFRIYGSSGGRNVNTLTVNTGVGSTKAIIIECAGGTNGSQSFMRIYNANSGVYATIAASAEL